MDRHWALRILTSSLLLATAGTALAYTSTFTNEEYSAQAVQPPFEGGTRISDITRQNGGALYKLDLAKAIPLTNIKAKAKTGRAKIISVTVVTDNQERIPVNALTNATISEKDQALVSENINSTANIASIEIQAEAMGGNAAIDISALSTKEIPQLAPHQDMSCNQRYDAVLKEKLDVVQTWAARADGSVAGSWQEKYASKEFTKYVNEFITTIKNSNNTYASTEYTVTLLNFFTDRHNLSRPDSAAEQGYKAMATATFEVFMAAITAGESCRPVTSDAVINIALDFQKRNDATKPDSRARKLYEIMITQLGKIAPSLFQKELLTKNMNFRQADAEGYKYYKLFASSKPDSFLKGTNQEMSNAAYAVAEAALRNEVKSMDNEKRYALIVEYQAKYNDTANYPQDVMLKYLMILSEDGMLFRLRL